MWNEVVNEKFMLSQFPNHEVLQWGRKYTLLQELETEREE